MTGSWHQSLGTAPSIHQLLQAVNANPQPIRSVDWADKFQEV